MKLIIPLMFCTLMLAGFASSCKHNPVAPPQKCDTCKCDTCKDTTHVPTDTTSHNFTWTQSTISGEAGLTGCWVFGPNSIYVVGGSVYKSTDGMTWKEITPTDTKGYSLSGLLSGCSMFAFSEKDYWLTYGFIGHVVNGVEQQYPFGDTIGFLHSCWGTSSNDIYAVGDGGTILHFDGSTWTKMQSGTTKNIKTIWGTTDANIWAAGYNPTTGESVLLHYNGTGWSLIDLATLGNISPQYHSLDAVWSCDSAGHSFVVASGTLLFRNTDLKAWRSDSGFIPNRLSDGTFIGLYNLKGNAANDIMAAGDYGLIVHWNGASWIRYETLYNVNDPLYIANALGLNANTACAAGGSSSGSWVAVGRR